MFLRRREYEYHVEVVLKMIDFCNSLLSPGVSCMYLCVPTVHRF
jgi:hypothetical protein